MRIEKQWLHLESTRRAPQRAQRVEVVSFNEVLKIVETNNIYELERFARALYAGWVFILRGAFPTGFMRETKQRTIEWMRERPPSFHKMLEGSPDFHRMIDLESGRKYSFHCCKHSAYFYRWNNDPLQIWSSVTERWRVVKVLMGLEQDEYERFTPKDGVVDRIQIVRYPPAIGYLEPHADPHMHQRLFFSGYMSKRGVDYQGGGFYLVGPGDRVIDIEDALDVGDACIGYATVVHGVAPCDRDKVPDWGATDGRWFLSMYSNASDEMPNRHTGQPSKLNIPHVLPFQKEFDSK